MIKKLCAIVTVLLISCIALFGCSGEKYTAVKIDGKQDTNYTVMNNGGNVVTYGNYVYFINGTRGYEDTDGKANIFGEVVKGGVYRAEFEGQAVNGEFVVGRNDETFLGLKSHKAIDYKRDEVNVVDTQAVAPKTVGTSSYADGGIFIIDDCMYYASPNNEKNKTGSVQYLKTDFFRMTLDGKKTQKLYTTNNDSNEAPYSFMKYNGKVYLVVLDGDELISVRISKNGKVEDTLRLAEDITSAVIPTKPVYYNGVSENTIYDFIYTERAATKDDATQTGEVLEFMRPDGTGKTKFEADGATDYKLETVKDGYLFYLKNDNTKLKLYANNMHAVLYDNNAAYKAEADTLLTDNDATNDPFNVSKFVLSASNLASVKIYPFVDGYEFGKIEGSTNAIDVVTVTAASGEGSQASLAYYKEGDFKASVSGSAITFDTVHEGNIYYTVDGALKKMNILNGEYQSEQIVTGIVNGTYGAEIVENYLVYFGTVNDAAGYTCFYDLNGLEGNNDPILVGELNKGDEPSETEELILVENPDKTQYEVGEKIDLTGLVIEAQAYADKDGNRPENKEIKVTSDMVSGFDSSVAGEITVTITYDKKTTTIAMTIVEGEKKAEDNSKNSNSTIVWVIVVAVVVLVLAVVAVLLGKKKKNNKSSK